MLHFMENHDEQRLASKFVAGDIWKGVPAMVISATIDRGAVMVYAGQEVGEPAVGAEGFSGDDGRTTIFDYWSMPEYRKWVNGGAFDGGQLSMEQKQLRIFYDDLLNLAGKNPAIVNGDYHDLTPANQANGNFDDQVCAYIRNKDGEKLLVVAGFNSKEKSVRVHVPKETGVAIGLDTSATYIARDLLWKEVEVGFDKDWSFELRMKPYSVFIFKIK
jgi:glycosidase